MHFSDAKIVQVKLKSSTVYVAYFISSNVLLIELFSVECHRALFN